MISETVVLGPYNMAMPAGWECVICGVPPGKDEQFTMVSQGEDIRNLTVTVQHMFITDCGLNAEFD